jgi:DNA modification methylase
MTIAGRTSTGIAGSATTGAAAIRSGRSFVGCEMSADYHQIGLERLRAEEATSTAAATAAGQGTLFTEAS